MELLAMPYLKQCLASQYGGPGSVRFVVEKVAGFSPRIFVSLHTHSYWYSKPLWDSSTKGSFLTWLQKTKGADAEIFCNASSNILFVFIFSWLLITPSYNQMQQLSQCVMTDILFLSWQHGKREKRKGSPWVKQYNVTWMAKAFLGNDKVITLKRTQQ